MGLVSPRKARKALARVARRLAPVYSARDIIDGVYRGVLGRPVDEGGLDYYQKQIENGLSIEAFVAALLESEEFAGQASHQAMPLAIDGAFSPEEEARYWGHVAAVWSQYGESDPYWSVLTDDRYQATQLDERALRSFYEAGRRDAEQMDACLARNGAPPQAGAVCAEYGCGVGRVTLWLARRFSRVIAFDVSEPHIAAAERYLSEQGVRNVDFALVRGPESLGRLAEASFFYSILVLQHNPPPIIRAILQAAFTRMGEGSHFYFQLPTYIPEYTFNASEYIAGLGREHVIEMHCLPQRAVFELAAAAGAQPIEALPDHRTGRQQKHWLSATTFLMAK